MQCFAREKAQICLSGSRAETEPITMSDNPHFDCDTLYLRIAFYIREADGYIINYELV